MGKHGWHDNELEAYNVTVENDLTVKGTISFGDEAVDKLIIQGRVSSMIAAGAAIQITSSYAYGEGIEMRYQVTDWTGVGSSFKGMYLRAEAITGSAAAKSVYGAEIYGVCNNVTMTTGSLWGSMNYAYVKGIGAVTINNMYAVQGELSWDASRTGDCTITTAAACFRAKITGGRVADYTKIHGYELTIGEMDGDSAKFGKGLFMQDDSGMSGTCTLTTGIDIAIGCITGISISGATTDALSISGDATTAINITSGCTPTDGLKIAGACANAINITGVATTRAIVMTSQTAGMFQGTSTMTLSSAHRNAFEINAISSANAAYELRGLYVTTYPSTTAQATSKMRGVYSEVKSALNLDNMVAVYGYANMSAAKTIATGSAALHGDVNVDNATTLSAGRMAALWAQVRGDSALTGNLDCIYADAEMNVDTVLYMNVDTSKTATVGMNLAGAGTYTTGISISATAVTTGIAISAGSLTDGIKISGTTPVDGLEISSACSANGINISGTCVTGISMTNASTVGMKISAGPMGFDLTSTLPAGAAVNANEINVTDNSTGSSGYARALWLNVVVAGDKTGTGEHNSLGIDQNVSGNCAYLYGMTYYSSDTGDPTIGFAAPISVYQDDLGTNLGAYVCIDLGIALSNAPTDRYHYMRFRDHSSAIPTSVFRFEGGHCASYLFDTTGGTGTPDFITTNAGQTPAADGVLIAINYHGTPYYLKAASAWT